MLLESSNRVWEALSYGLFDIKNKRVPWNAPPPYLNLNPGFAPMMDQRNIRLHA